MELAVDYHAPAISFHAPYSLSLDLLRAFAKTLSPQQYTIKDKNYKKGRLTSMKSPSTPTATQALAMQGISSRRPPLATPPPSSCPHSAVRKMNSCVDKPFLL
jgi:hypothetical protein